MKNRRQPPMDALLRKILECNPHIDAERILKLMEERKQRKGGLRVRGGYKLASPFIRRRVSVNRDESDRTIVLGRRAIV